MNSVHFDSRPIEDFRIRLYSSLWLIEEVELFSIGGFQCWPYGQIRNLSLEIKLTVKQSRALYQIDKKISETLEPFEGIIFEENTLIKWRVLYLSQDKD